MKSIITDEELFRQLNNTRAVLRDRMEMNDRELTDAENEALAEMAIKNLYNDVDYINKTPKIVLHREFMKIKRIEAKDIFWLTCWSFLCKAAINKRARFGTLKMFLYFLIQEDLRRPIGAYSGDDEYINIRSSISEIHEDYARILGVSAKDVTFAIRELEREGRIKKIDAWCTYYDCDESGYVIEEVEGVVYVPCKVYCAIVDGRKRTFSKRRL